jgi:hypothetical protein
MTRFPLDEDDLCWYCGDHTVGTAHGPAWHAKNEREREARNLRRRKATKPPLASRRRHDPQG